MFKVHFALLFPRFACGENPRLIYIYAEQGDPLRKNFRGDDKRNSLRRYEDVLGAQPMPAHVRGSMAGFHIDWRFPSVPFLKEPIKGASPREFCMGPAQPARSLDCSDIAGR